MNGNDLSGLGDWAYRGQPSAYGTHNPSTVRNSSLYAPTSSRSQQSYPISRESSAAQATFAESFEPRRPAPSIYTLPPTHSNAPYYVVPSTPPNVDQARSYAAVASNGQRSSTTSSYASSHQPQMQQTQHSRYQRPMIAQLSRLSVEVAGTSSNTIQRQPQQGPSWAQVVASGHAETSNPNQSYHRPANDAFMGHTLASQQYSQPAMGQLSYGVPNTGGSQAPGFFGNWPGGVPLDDTWTLDSAADFTLYDDSTPYVPTGSLVVNTSSPAPPSRLLMSPADSIDTSSMTSSTRRSRREIMGGDSGPFKCQHCPAGFMTPDDRRYYRPSYS